MVRDSTLRSSKFSAKNDSDVIRSRFEAQKESMNTQVQSAFANQALVEQSTKAVIEDEGVSSILVPFYIAFAKQLEKLKTKYSSTDAASTGGLEAQLIADKWLARGLTNTVLVAVAADRGYTVTFGS